MLDLFSRGHVMNCFTTWFFCHSDEGEIFGLHQIHNRYENEQALTYNSQILRSSR